MTSSEKMREPDIKKMKEKGDINGLINALGDKSLCVEASDALENIGKAAVGPLIQALKDKDSDVRRRVVITLGEIGDAKAVKALIPVLKDKDSLVLLETTFALGKIGDEKAVEPLIQVMRKDERDYVRKDAALALTMIKARKNVF